MKTLYVCYLGLREPLVQTQVLPYLRGVAQDGVAVHLLTFEPQCRRRWSAEERREWSRRLQAHGIQWHARTYHKTPSVPATLFDIAVGAWTVWRLVRRHRLDVVHARSHVPMAMALLVRWVAGCRLIFDLRGLLAEEYAAAGRWKDGSLVFRAVKRLERFGLRHADRIVVLTHRLQRWLTEREGVAAGRIEIIPCCVESAAETRDSAGRNGDSPDRLEIVYAGSVTGLYQLEEMGRFFLALRRRCPGAFFRVLTQAPVAYVVDVLSRAGLSAQDFWAGSVAPEDVPGHLRNAHVGLSFRRMTFAQIGASPTKIAEYLAAGLPVVCNAGVGDMDAMLETRRVGVIVPSAGEEAYEAAATQLVSLLWDAELRDRCREAARDYFDLERVGVARYRRLYQGLREALRRPRKRVLFLVPYPRACAPSQRLKFEQYYSSFEQQGIEVTTSSFVSPALWRILYEPGHWFAKGFWTGIGYLRRAWDFLRAGRFDAVYLHLWAVPFGPPWFEEWLARRNILIIYDIDDLIYLPNASRANAFLARLRKKEVTIARIMRVATHVIVCTQHLERFARQHNPSITCISSTIDTTLYLPRRHSQAQSSVTIGWSGSHSTTPYLHLLESVLQVLSRQFDIRLLVIGDARVRMEGVRVEARPWSVARETADLAEMDIGVYPLPDEEWALGKSGLKALQYMGMGIPVVASAIGEACRFIRDGENGWLARTPEEWVDRLSQLIRDPQRRCTMGMAGRMTVEQSFSVEVTASRYHRVLNAVLHPAIEGLRPVAPSTTPVPWEAHV